MLKVPRTEGQFKKNDKREKKKKLIFLPSIQATGGE